MSEGTTRHRPHHRRAMGARSLGDRFELSLEDDRGQRIRLPLGEAAGRRIEAYKPVRGSQAYLGQAHISGWYWAATDKTLVPYESQLELWQLIALDFDRRVVAIAAQLRLHGGGLRSSHVPDFFVRLDNGGGRVVDVKAERERERQDIVPDSAATRQACAAVGWATKLSVNCPRRRRSNFRLGRPAFGARRLSSTRSPAGWSRRAIRL